jgi:GNAT superfamily N-acetyltransferase
MCAPRIRFGMMMVIGLAGVSSYWEEVVSSVGAGERLLICATVDYLIAGTVQLCLSPEHCARHRGEVYKLLVDRKFRNRGIGEALTRVQGGARERLYQRLSVRASPSTPPTVRSMQRWRARASRASFPIRRLRPLQTVV